MSEDHHRSPNGIWRDLAKVAGMSIVAAAMTTYVSVSVLNREVQRNEVQIERTRVYTEVLAARIEAIAARIAVIEVQASERGPWIRDLEQRVRALETANIRRIK